MNTGAVCMGQCLVRSASRVSGYHHVDKQIPTISKYPTP